MSLINYNVVLFRRKIGRALWRSTHSTAPHRTHGGRGKKYGMKAGKQPKLRKMIITKSK